ncbi:hypothetical protein [Bradyrhizobium sp. CCGB01]|uniref:hypothetical protein n=1 Tax=Bradyrhizobium sp. CCGB01 TaxID=2949634 RepID=UPI0020B393D8|nr:hypothetical protein [Bradyrhizobium sp. CCGB01]MCP3407391.1 hypothetical protein [Bradyrhizobium sp. CCGB01]
MFGHRNLVDGAEVQLAELLCDAGVIADSYADLHSNILLYDDIAEITEIAEAEEPVMPMMSMMPMMTPVMSSAHGVEFRIDQFTHSTHDFPPWGVAMNNMWLEPYWRVSFPSVTEITGGARSPRVRCHNGILLDMLAAIARNEDRRRQ